MINETSTILNNNFFALLPKSPEIKILLNQIITYKNDNDKMLEVLRQINTILQYNREESVKNIEQLTKFIERNFNLLSVKIIIKIFTYLSKLLFHNLSLQLILCNHFFKTFLNIVKEKDNTEEENKYLIKAIGNIIKISGSHLSNDIKDNIDIIGDKCSKEETPTKNKIILLQILIEFINSSPIVSFNKMMKIDDFLIRIILINFKDEDINMRLIISELTYAFFSLIKNRDINIKKNYFQILYDLIFKHFKNINEESDLFALHGCILLIKPIILIKELFYDKSKEILEILFKYKNSTYLPIKNAIIEYIPDLTDYLENNEKLFEKFCDFLIDEYILNNNDSYNSLILLSLKKLSTQIDKSIFEIRAEKIILCLKNKFENKKYIIKKDEIICLSELLINYSESILKKIDLNLIFDKIFECGFNDTHVNFLQKIINLYSTQIKDEIKMIKIILISLNVISLILAKKMDLNNSFKHISKYFNTLNTSETKIYFKKTYVNTRTKIGQLLISFLEKEQKNKNTFENTKLEMTISAFKLLKIINHPSFAKDILFFYQKSCFPLLKQKIKSVQKIEIISLITANWFNYKEDDKEINTVIEHILEDLLNYYLIIKNENIKKSILENLDERFDVILLRENFLKKIFFLFDYSESPLKVDIMRILSRLKKYNPIISMFLKKEILRILNILKFSCDVFEKEKEISLLSFYIQNLKDMILEYFDKSIFEILIKEINNNEYFYNNQSDSLSDVQEKECNDDLNLKISSILTELVSSSCNFVNRESEDLFYKDILEACINILKESTDITSQEILLKTILTIFENSVNYWDVYSDFSELVFILIKILKYSSSNDTRIFSLKIFGYIGAMDPDKLDIFLNLQNNALSNAEHNLEDKNFQIFDDNESEKNYRQLNKKKFINGVVNYLNSISEYTGNLNFEFAQKKENGQNDLLNDVISSLFVILNDGNKKEHAKNILIILMRIISYLKKEEENHQKKSEESNVKTYESEAIELILNSFLKHPAKNIKKEYKIGLIYYIIVFFKNIVKTHYEELFNLVIDSIKHEEFIDIALSILFELLQVNMQFMNNHYNKLIMILLDLLNKKAEEIGSILIIDDPIISKIIDCFNIMSEKITDSLNIILDDIFDLLNISLVNIQKKNLFLKSEEAFNELERRENKNNDNIIISEFQIEKKIRKQTDIFDNNENDFNDLDNILFNDKDNNNSIINTNSPMNENNKLESNLHKNNNFMLNSSAKKKIMFNGNTIVINEKIFKKILNFIKKIILYENFHEYVPQLIIILKKYICFCSESRNDIIEFFFSLLKARPNMMNFYLPSIMDLMYKYKISFIPYTPNSKIAPNILDKSLEQVLNNNNNSLQNINNDNNQYPLDFSLIEKYISMSFKSINNEEKEDENIKQVFEKILEDFNPKNYSLKDDWKEWFYSCCKQLFNYSPNKIIKYCSELNDSLPNLYKYAFYEFWKNLNKNQKIEIASYLTIVINKESLPNDIRLIILNLIEFIQREQLYIEYFDNSDLSNAAKKCKVFAKELYYIENHYSLTNDKHLLKRIMDLYYELNLPESVVGISITEKNNPTFKEEDNWFLKLRQWDMALKRIKEKRKNEPPYNIDLIMDNFACLEGLSDWNNLLLLNDEIQSKKNDIFINENDNKKYNKINYYVAESALYLNNWEKLKMSVSEMNPDNDDEKFDKTLYETILNINDGELTKAKNLIEEARLSLLDKIKILLTESYERAYKLLLLNDNLYQLEEIIQLKEYQKQNNIYNNQNIISKKDYILNKDNLKNRWDKRMKIISEDSRAYEKILAIRNLVLNYEEDYEKHLDLAKICRENDDFKKSMNILERLKQKTKKIHISLSVTLSLSKCLNENYESGDNNIKAKDELEKIIKEKSQFYLNDEMSKKLSSKFYCYYGFILMNQWNDEKGEKKEKDVNNILQYLELSTQNNPNNYKAWHLYALLNYKYFEYTQKTRINYAINAIEGFTKSICIGKNMSKILQDLLLLLDIWFKVGIEESIDHLMNEKISIISLESWFMVIPQLLARINVTNPLIRKTLISLLKKIGLNNPRSLTYNLTVLKNSKSKTRAEAVSLILENIKEKHEQLFKESELIINELNRSALCLHEQWIETIEESAKLFFQTKDIKMSTKILSELHKKMQIKPQTMNEIHFHHQYRSDLNEAYKLLQDFLENDNLISLKEAWDIYQECYTSMSNEFANVESMDLKSISPALFQFRESEIEIPGIYQNMGSEAIDSVVKISSFSRKLIVLKSKEKPRKIVIYGSDGKEYPYLLKGHEDIRQDERVMQLFGLINTLLSKDSDTRGKNLSIKRYPVIPLSHNTGIIGWVSNCDTLNQLIKEYRTKNNIPVNMEYRLLTKFHHKSDSSLSMTKLEVFKHTLSNTVGSDINKVLWTKSQSAEDWLDRRTNYSRSLAVMSIVGYILGLGDRHPSNIMLDRISGKVMHIDFGDCFEVAMKRDKFPEKVPFRLTRMLIKALEIGGIEGTFRITCENVMRVVRENKDSLNVILAAFVHDPLTSFRLLIPLIMKNVKTRNKFISKEDQEKKIPRGKMKNSKKNIANIINENKRGDKPFEKKRIGSDERQLFYELEEKDDIESDDLNQIVKIVLERVSDKLNGTDFNKNEELKINVQVQRLIRQATSHENLSQSYIGWCPFW